MSIEALTGPQINRDGVGLHKMLFNPLFFSSNKKYCSHIMLRMTRSLVTKVTFIKCNRYFEDHFLTSKVSPHPLKSTEVRDAAIRPRPRP